MPESNEKIKTRKLPGAMVFIIFVFALLLLSILVIEILHGTEPALLRLNEISNPENLKTPESWGNKISSVIVVDAGHGGIDCGAIGKTSGVQEDELNLDVAKKLKKLLADSGAKVIMTRETEDAIAKTKDLDMERRREIILHSNADMVISIHMNFFSDISSSGPQVFYYESSEEGLMLARSIQLKLNEVLEPLSPRIHMKGDYFILRSGDAPAVIVECGFLSNAKEEKLLIDEGYRGKIAQAVFEGIVSYVNRTDDADAMRQ